MTCLSSLGAEPGINGNQIQKEQDLNSGAKDYKSSAPNHLVTPYFYKNMVRNNKNVFFLTHK